MVLLHNNSALRLFYTNVLLHVLFLLLLKIMQRDRLKIKKVKMDGKTVLVTGANKGIGKETARELAKRGARVIMGCRNLETGRKARDEIIESTKNINVVLKKIDLSSFQSIRAFAEDINKTEPKLHVLIHNAGVVITHTATSEDGLELTMATNHFGPFLLTHLLIDLLKKSTPSRIVIVSSIAHHLGMLKFKDINYIPSFMPRMNYLNSKLANILFTRELARRLEGTNITANSVHPGLVYTEIWNSLPIPFKWLLRLSRKLFLKSAVEGSEKIVYLATSEEVANVSGKYFVNCKKSYVANRAFQMETAKNLWEISEKVVKLYHNDSRI